MAQPAPLDIMDHASPTVYDEPASDGDSVEGYEQELKQEHDLPLISPASASSLAENKASAVKLPKHLQKRRRVTRACDECRRKKIKCDGKQPCTHCTVYSYDCTYDQPSNRRRNPAPQYVENLEHRVHRAETLLHILIPNLDLNDPGIEAAVAQGWIPGAPGKGNPPAGQQPALNHANGNQLDRDATNRLSGQTAKNKPDTSIESMVRAVAQMDIDESGHWDYHGHWSGLSFVRRMREQLGELMGPETVSTPFVKTLPRRQFVDSPKSAAGSPMLSEVSAADSDLLPRDAAEQICTLAINDAAVLLQFVHQPTFWKSFEQLYSRTPEQYTTDDYKFLPLFHTSLALGHMFCKDESSRLNREGYQGAIQKGFTHFRLARQLMDIADCRDITSLQAIIMMVLFLQSSAKLSQCYAYIGLAMRSALRMGLHRSFTGKFNPLEVETRKRVFWVIRKLDIYLAAMIGLPLTLSDEDIDQDFPVEVDDEYITEDGIQPMPEGEVSLMAGFNAHTRLVQILQKIVRTIYPIKVQGNQSADKSYSVPFSAIREIESDLETWKNALPPSLSPSPTADRYQRVQQLLRLSYAHAQVMLYRPFLHYTTRENRSKLVDQRAYACAASHVNVSRNIIHITAHMKQKGLLNGAYWFIMYTTFFSVLSLVYFAAENQDNATTQAVMKDAIQGRDVLASLSTRSMAADRTSVTLSAVFQRLPAWMREGKPNPAMSKKRPHAPSPQASTSGPVENEHASRSHTKASEPGVVEVETSASQRRSSTVPRIGRQVSVNTSPTLYETPWPASVTSSYGLQMSTTKGFDPNAFVHPNLPPHQQHDLSGVNRSLTQFSPLHDVFDPTLPELSAMMFPAADEPFAYPTQPLAAFESGLHDFAKNNTYSPFDSGSLENDPSLSTGPVVPSQLQRTQDDNIEAQFYALPPFIQNINSQQLQQMHPHLQQQQHPSQQGLVFNPEALGFANGHAAGVEVANGLQMPRTWPALQQAQQRQGMQTGAGFGEINLQDLFGSAEWSHPMLMNPGGYVPPQ